MFSDMNVKETLIGHLNCYKTLFYDVTNFFTAILDDSL